MTWFLIWLGLVAVAGCGMFALAVYSADSRIRPWWKKDKSK